MFDVIGIPKFWEGGVNKFYKRIWVTISVIDKRSDIEYSLG